jgi:hypothetical protein
MSHGLTLILCFNEARTNQAGFIVVDKIANKPLEHGEKNYAFIRFGGENNARSKCFDVSREGQHYFRQMYSCNFERFLTFRQTM